MTKAPLPKVWMKISAAQVQPDGTWRWPKMQIPCRFMGFVTDDGRRVRSMHEEHFYESMQAVIFNAIARA